MKTILLILLVLPSIAIADSDWMKEQKVAQASANKEISKLQNYQCFAEQYQLTARLPWEKTGLETGPAHMLIRQSKDGILFAQPVPDCAIKSQCGYWIRSETWEQGFFRAKIVKVECPKKLNRKAVEDLILTEYKDILKLNY